jgi:hypothetical protein
MHRRIVLVTLVGLGVVGAGGAAFGVANSVSTTPQPAYISHLDKSVIAHPSPPTSDDRGKDAVSPSTSAATTAVTVEDHGGLDRDRAVPSGRAAATGATHRRGDDRAPTASPPTTIDDHRQDAASTTPTTFDDRGSGHDASGSGGSGPDSRHSGGSDDSGGSGHR